jgi:NADPH:quinone reductase-like Zn-dependent oxidoreductase
MRAVVYDRYGSAEVLRVGELPVPRPGRGEVLVRVRAAALNPKDVLVRKGKFRRFTGNRFPRPVGYDFAGEVAESGPDVRELLAGTRVFGMLNGFWGGTCAEYVVARQDELAPMPASLSFTQAAAIPLAAQTALQALRDIGRVRPGTSVLINGASGGVGTFAIQLARDLGGHVTTVSSEQNLALCRELGAHEALDYRQDTFLDGTRRQDVFFDVFGNQSFSRARAALRAGGVYIQTVPSARIVLDTLRTALTSTRARLVVVKSRSEDLRHLARLAESGALRPVVDREYALEEVRAAQEQLETKRTRGKVVLRVDGPGS